MRSPGSCSAPIPGAAAGDEDPPESPPLSPSLMPLPRPYLSLTGGGSMPPSRTHLAAPWRRPASERPSGTSPSCRERHHGPSTDPSWQPPWARRPASERPSGPGTSPSQYPPSGRPPAIEMTPATSPSRCPPWGRPPGYLDNSQGLNPDSDPVPERRAKTSLFVPRADTGPTSPPATRPAAVEEIPTPSARRRRRRATKSRKSELDSPLSPFRSHLPESEPHLPNNTRKKSSKRNKRAAGAADGTSQEEKKSGQEAASAHEEVSQEQLGSDSSTYSSPLREPQAPLVPIWTTPSGDVLYGITEDRAAAEDYHWGYRKYEEKRARLEELPTLSMHVTLSSIKEAYSPKQKETFLNAAKSVLSLSAYHDGKQIDRCTGIVVEWDEVKKCAVILTSAWIICTNKPFDDWSNKDYAPDAKVIVHLLDGTTSERRLLYLSKHYDVAFFEIMGGSQLQILPLEPNFAYGQDLCILARDDKMGLICRTVKVKYLDPCEHQHNHYQFISGSIPKCGTGGALADFSGKIVGMLFRTLPLIAFIPSSLILECSRLWRKFGRLVRPQLGLKFRTVGFLDMARIELLSRSYSITSGLIVGEVSAQCAAEKLGIRVGDVILSCQGESISSVSQLEDILLGAGERHLEKGNDLSSKVGIEVDVFHVRKCTRRHINLTVELSDGIEVFV